MRRFGWNWWRNRFFDLVGALFLVAIGVYLWQWATVYIRESAPYSEWVNITRLEVPNIAVGGDPVVVFQREIDRDMTTEWYSELFRVGGDQVCSGRGPAALYVSEPTTLEVPLSKLVGPGCTAKPGTYILQLTLRLRDEMGAEKTVPRNSNPFEIAPAAGQYLQP